MSQVITGFRSAFSKAVYGEAGDDDSYRLDPRMEMAELTECEN